MKLVTVSQMQAVEKEADSNGLTYDQMMQNAGQGLAEVAADLFVDDDQLEIIGLVGPGNNGGDTLVALTALAEEGWKSSAFLVKRKKDDLVKQFTDAGGQIIPSEKEDAFFHLSSFVNYILNTPKRVSGIGAFKLALIASPNTSRVCAGSMMPSSHSRAVA